MAWREIQIDSFIPTTNPNFLTSDIREYNWSQRYRTTDITGLPFTKGDSIITMDTSPTIIYQDSNYTFQYFRTNTTAIKLELYLNDSLVYYDSKTFNDLSSGTIDVNTFFGLDFLVDDDLEIGCIAISYINHVSGVIYDAYSNNYQNSQFDIILYNFLTNLVPPITYQWQSVPSISGKNGILTLSTLNDVNDGEPVETSDISKFNLTDDSNVSALVAAHFSQ